MMNDKKTRQIVMVSLLTAIIAVATIVIVIPIPNITGAYINAGDAAVYTAVYVLGGPWGALCAAVGSALADMILGSVVYAPATFVIKGAMAYITGLAMARMREGGKPWAGFIGGIVMPLGYFLYECAILGRAAAVPGVPFNLLQYAGGAILGMLAIRGLSAAKSLKKKER